MADEDFSAGNLPKNDIDTLNLGISESRHRIGVQTSVFQAVLTFSAMMYMATMAVTACLVYMLAENPGIHWHASLLIAALAVPPTVMMVALLRAVFQTEKEKQEKDDRAVFPAHEMIKEIAKGLKDAVSKPASN